jgi:hypothetical protein
MICTVRPVLLGGHIEKNEMVGACNTYGGTGKVYTGFWLGNLKERANLDDTGADGWIILRWIFKKLDVGYGLD